MLDVEGSFREHERHLWGLCYRLTGVAADADELVQETFLRALERPPGEVRPSMRPWLARIATHLALDRLRRRRHAAYTGVWLPSPVDADAVIDPGASAEDRLSEVESLSMAWLIAIEALTPRQRAVLVLRDVLDYSGEQTARVLDTTPGNVKVTLHKARRRLDAFPRPTAGPEVIERALFGFFRAVAVGDLEAAEAFLAAEARGLADGGGVYRAAGVPVVGAARLARAYAQLARHAVARRVVPCRVGGLPALAWTDRPRREDWPPRGVIGCWLDAHGRIATVWSQLAPRKLRGGRWFDAFDAPGVTPS